MKILVADDDPVSRRLMQNSLQRSGYEVITAADGLSALRELRRPGGPKLALIDWMMPELDGPSVCREVRLRTDEPYIYLLLLTSRESDEDTVAGLEAGADDYLTKPCHPAELRARLQVGQRILQLEDKLVEAREAMRFRATHDGLTGLMNRTAILAKLQQAMQRVSSRGGAISLLLGDVDHFKKINDVHGHLVGDEVLEQMAVRLREAVRAEDIISRYGGEEFLIILDDCGMADSIMRAEEVRMSIAGLPFATEAGPLNISASFGVITFDPFTGPTSVASLIKQVDDALYQAKALGRNCVQLAQSAVLV